MATLTISSGVHIGARSTGSINQDWFGDTPTTEFTTFALSSANADVRLRRGPQAISGHASLTDAPVAFEFNRLTRDALSDSLAAVATKDLLNGGPQPNLHGYRTAAARAGYLAKFAWSERSNDGTADPTFEVWGVCRVTVAEVRGLRESMTLLVYPTCLLWTTGSEVVVAAPTCYENLPAGEVSVS